MLQNFQVGVLFDLFAMIAAAFLPHSLSAGIQRVPSCASLYRMEVREEPGYSLSELVQEFPGEFRSVSGSLLESSGYIEDLEARSARFISFGLDPEERLLLTPSVFGFRGIPFLDGVIYQGDNPVFNISIKSVDLRYGSVRHPIEKLRSTMKSTRNLLRRDYSIESFLSLFQGFVNSEGEIDVPLSSAHRAKRIRQREELVKLFGFREKPQRKIVVAVTFVHEPKGLKFRISRRRGQTHLAMEETDRKINLSRLLDIATNDPVVGGFILASSQSMIFIDAKRGIRLHSIGRFTEDSQLSEAQSP